jgi:type VI secretion system protein ImpK
MPSIREDFGKSWGDRTNSGVQNLAGLCRDAFSLIFHIHAGNDPGHPEDLKKNIALLLQDLDRQAKHSGYSEEDIKATRYALCALIDETILNSRWAFRDKWAEQPLQSEYFGDYMAGERFFDLLEKVRQKGDLKADLLEVFCLCLILGFQGKYKMGGKEALSEITRRLVDETNRYHGGLSNLALHWKIPEEMVEKPADTIPRWVWITGISAIFAVILLFVIFKIWLGSAAADAAQQLIL